MNSQNKQNLIESYIIDKKRREMEKEREITEKSLNEIQQQLQSLNSQRIANPSSVYSHPAFKQYINEAMSKKAEES